MPGCLACLSLFDLYDRPTRPIRRTRRPRLSRVSFKFKKREKKASQQKIKTPKGVHGHTRAAPAPPPAKAGAAGGLPAPSPNPPWKSPSARWGSKVPRGAKSRRAEGRERLSWLSSGVVGSSPPPLERGRTCARATYGRVCDAGEAERQPPWGRAKGPYTTR